jgi:hypothetical protein
MWLGNADRERSVAEEIKSLISFHNESQLNEFLVTGTVSKRNYGPEKLNSMIKNQGKLVIFL